MKYQWQSGDAVRVRPIWTLPAGGTEQAMQIRSPYFYPAVVRGVQYFPNHTVVVVILDDHESIPMLKQKLQHASVTELHPGECLCRRCNRVPHNHRAEYWPTRLHRWARCTGDVTWKLTRGLCRLVFKTVPKALYTRAVARIRKRRDERAQTVTLKNGHKVVIRQD